MGMSKAAHQNNSSLKIYANREEKAVALRRLSQMKRTPSTLNWQKTNYPSCFNVEKTSQIENIGFDYLSFACPTFHFSSRKKKSPPNPP